MNPYFELSSKIIRCRYIIIRDIINRDLLYNNNDNSTLNVDGIKNVFTTSNKLNKKRGRVK